MLTKSVAWVILFSASGWIALAQNPPATPPPPQPLAQPTPTSPVPPSGGATINAATGQPVTNITAGSGAGPVTNQLGALVVTNVPGVGITATNVRPGLLGSGIIVPGGGRSNITPIQLQNINRLVTALNGLGLPSRDPADQQRGLIETLQAAPIATVRPAPELITALAVDLGAIVPSLNLTAPQRRQLAIDLNLGLNSGNLSPEEAQLVLADARSLLQGSASRNPQGVERLMGRLAVMVSQIHASSAQAGTGSVPAQTGQAGGSQTGQGAGNSSVPREGLDR